MKLSAAHDSSGSEHPDVRELVFMNHEAPPSIAIDIQS
jgi:hypothetical protein